MPRGEREALAKGVGMRRRIWSAVWTRRGNRTRVRGFAGRVLHPLAKILEEFIDKELQPWIKTFPDDFYREMFRLRGLSFPDSTVHRPKYFGVLTNDIVYKRLAPGVLVELRRVTPKDSAGRPKHKYFQWLTSNVGYPKLREHLGSVVTLMKLSSDWHDFQAKLDRIHPRAGDTMLLPFDDDNGQGL